MSLFKRKQSLPPDDKARSGRTGNGHSPHTPTRTSRAASTPAAMSSASIARVHLDDFGRKIQPGPAFTLGAKDATGAVAGYGVGDDEEPSELQLMYGYAVLATTLELGVIDVDYIVSRCAEQLKLRGLDTPLILSSSALDQSMEGTNFLIRSYTSNVNEWGDNLQFAAPLDVGTFLKWGLARLVNDKGGRGFLSWDFYSEFKVSEKARSYPPRFCAESLVNRLPKAVAHLLTNLLELFSSLAAHSGKNGMTPRKIASLFGAFAFGLSDDQPFDETYLEWQRITDAFEHILLSYIRGQQDTVGGLPTHLEKFVLGYPACLNITYASGAKQRPPRGAKVEEVTRVRRLTRFHSRNLIQSAGTWEVPHSPEWSLFYPKRPPPGSPPSSAAPKPIFTPTYRHLLNIRSGFSDEDEDEGEIQRYKSTIEKAWGDFGSHGFKEVDASKLEFDLSESERKNTRKKHETMDWSTFANQGFGGRETFAPSDLIFRSNIAQTVQTWPASQVALDQRLRKTEKMLPAFPYDTTPHEEGRVLVDANFFEAWADALVASGWQRDELKESNWALVQWKCRVREGELPRGKSGSANDDRTEERWVLVEEFVPREYREELKDGKKKSSKRVSFLRSVRKKKDSFPQRLDASTYDPPPPLSTQFQSAYLSPVREGRSIDQSVFKEGPGSTKVMSLSNLREQPEPRGTSTYAASVSSSVWAGHGHEEDLPPPVPPVPSIPSLHPSLVAPAPASPDPSPSAVAPTRQMLEHGVGGTLSSQRRESAFKNAGNRGPVGYQKPPHGARAFLARIGTRKKTPPTSPYGPLGAVPSPAGESIESHDLPAAPRDSSSTIEAPHRDEGERGLPASIIVEAPPPPPPKPASPTPNTPTSPVPVPYEDSPTLGKLGALNPIAERPTSAYSGVETVASSELDDAYDGIDDDDVVQEGTVLFRGSRSFSPAPGLSPIPGPTPAESQVLREDLDGRDTLSVARAPPSSAPPVRLIPSSPAQTRAPIRLLPAVPRPMAKSQIPTPVSQMSPRPQDRHESLPPSPKPDAEVPIDEDMHQRNPRYMSNASTYSETNRVSNLVGMYQNRDAEVRLTQFGLGAGQQPALGRVVPQR